jgi:biofilm PGA synthesis N-glycosyltransferase PgaC
LKTVSVGIPSYNEGTNIVTILESVINSKQDSVELYEIIISDDSTDETPEIVKKFMENNSEKIVFLHNDGRRGAASAWNNIIQNAKGEIIVLYDADVVPNPNCMSELVNKINNNIGICASNPRPIRNRGIPAKGTIFISDWLASIRKKQLSEYTVMGRGLSIRSDIAKKITIPENLIAIDLYLQSQVTNMGYEVVFNPNAIVMFKPARTFVDFCSQVLRAIKGHNQIKKLGYEAKYGLTLKTSVFEFIHTALRNPVGAISACICYLVMPIYMLRIENLDSALWHTAQSTK